MTGVDFILGRFVPTNFVDTLFEPVWLAGSMLVCRALERGEGPRVGMLFRPFITHLGKLVAGGVVILIAVYAIDFAQEAFVSFFPTPNSSFTSFLIRVSFLLLILPVVIVLPLFPALIIFHDLSVFNAFVFSLRAAIANLLLPIGILAPALLIALIAIPLLYLPESFVLVRIIGIIVVPLVAAPLCLYASYLAYKEICLDDDDIFAQEAAE